jgi:hypothetical protein
MLEHTNDVLYEEEGFDPYNDEDLPNERNYDEEENIVAKAGGLLWHRLSG